MCTCTYNMKSYIGQTKYSLEKRFKHHIYEANYNRNHNKFMRALRKYDSKCWDCKILEKVSDINLLNEREVYWIAYYNTFNNGYNSISGGGQKYYIL